MTSSPHNPPDTPTTAGGYSQGVEVVVPGRLLHISGQIPVADDGAVPDGFEAQCRQVWHNVKAVLRSAGMSTDDLVKVTTFLSSRGDCEANSRIRREELAGAAPALTVVIATIYDEAWLLEIEATAFSSL
jgi:2-iminobutanoate/2-iminopropanoate deaminase